MVPVILAAATVAAAGMKMYGDVKSAREQAKAYKRQAAALKAKSTELQRRAEIDVETEYKQSNLQAGEFSNIRAMSGMTRSSSSEAYLSEIASRAQEQVNAIRQASQWEGASTTAEMEDLYQRAKATKKAGILGAAATGVQTGATIYSGTR
jgi:hypothetical protein